jgi:hypothetical protein
MLSATEASTSGSGRFASRPFPSVGKLTGMPAQPVEVSRKLVVLCSQSPEGNLIQGLLCRFRHRSHLAPHQILVVSFCLGRRSMAKGSAVCAAGFQLHSASTSWGISRKANPTKAGIMIKLSRCPSTGIRSGIRSIGEAGKQWRQPLAIEPARALEDGQSLLGSYRSQPLL